MAYPDREVSEADAAEQSRSAFPGDGDDAGYPAPSLDDEAPEWDAQEQRQVVPLDDDYR